VIQLRGKHKVISPNDAVHIKRVLEGELAAGLAKKIDGLIVRREQDGGDGFQ